MVSNELNRKSVGMFFYNNFIHEKIFPRCDIKETKLSRSGLDALIGYFKNSFDPRQIFMKDNRFDPGVIIRAIYWKAYYSSQKTYIGAISKYEYVSNEFQNYRSTIPLTHIDDIMEKYWVQLYMFWSYDEIITRQKRRSTRLEIMRSIRNYTMKHNYKGEKFDSEAIISELDSAAGEILETYRFTPKKIIDKLVI